MACFTALLEALGETPCYERALTLRDLGGCYGGVGRPDIAEAHYRRGIAVSEALQANELVLRHRAVLQTDLGDVLRMQGRYGEARAAYEASLAFVQAGSGSPRDEGVVLTQLGTLAMAEGNLNAAMRHYQEALALFRRLQEPAQEAILLHQLGIVYQQAQQLIQAEQHFREAAASYERLGDLAAAAGSWNALAVVCKSSGRPEAAEDWYCKAIAVHRDIPQELATDLSNLANLLRRQPARLAEARQLAEESLAIAQTLDPGAAQIWKTYAILAEIAEDEARPQEAADYRRLAREAKRQFPGTAQDVRRYTSLIAAVAFACGGHEQARADAEGYIQQFLQAGEENAEFAQALQRLLAGERDADALCERLSQTAPVLDAILAALANPDDLKTLLAQTGDPA